MRDDTVPVLNQQVVNGLENRFAVELFITIRYATAFAWDERASIACDHRAFERMEDGVTLGLNVFCDILSIKPCFSNAGVPQDQSD